MIIQSKHTKIFNSKDLTRQKYDELYDFAVLIQSHKNTVSQYVNDMMMLIASFSGKVYSMRAKENRKKRKANKK